MARSRLILHTANMAIQILADFRPPNPRKLMPLMDQFGRESPASFGHPSTGRNLHRRSPGLEGVLRERHIHRTWGFNGEANLVGVSNNAKQNINNFGSSQQHHHHHHHHHHHPGA